MSKNQMLRLGFLAGLIACGQPSALTQPAEAHPQHDTPAQVEPPQAEGAPSPVAVTSAALHADATTSTISWVGAKITDSHLGGFNQFSVDGTVSNGRTLNVISATIQMDSLFSDSERLTGHLKSDDFFDVENHPTAMFTSTSIQDGGEGGTHTVTGSLDLHGVVNQVSFPATIEATPNSAVFKAEFNIDRQRWNISYPGRPDDLIKDEVAIKLDINLGL